MLKHLACNVFYKLGHWGEVGIVAMVAEREGDRGDKLHTAFHSHSHSAGVVGVDRCVVAMVDASNDHVGGTPATELA